jgi:hypothetical protein
MAGQFCLRIPTSMFFYLPQICDMGQAALFPSEGRHAVDIFARKI